MANLSIFLLLLFFGLSQYTNAFPSNADIAKALRDDVADEEMHKIDEPSIRTRAFSSNVLTAETETSYWKKTGQEILKQQLEILQNKNVAKNIILFLGDGMSIPTLMAARTYLGQLQGNTGEESKLYWENFPHTGLIKTYCADSQVADSACSATAYLCGIKANIGTIGVNAKVTLSDCEAQLDESNHVSSIAAWAQAVGKSAGIVTTTRVTHASPSGTYANIANRGWESDKNVVKAGYNSTVCKDIATQLITEYPGKDFNVILGGGRREFLPKDTTDDEGTSGRRRDGVDLIDLWKREKADRGKTHKYIWNRNALQQVIANPENYEYLLGLFEASHCAYHMVGDATTEPTLAEMTEAAIKILRKNNKGYFLFVEGGRIDHAHHSTWAHLALDETVEMAKAVQVARELTSEDDTLIVVTSDHAHTMSIAGYPVRGNDIFGTVSTSDVDFLPYTTLNYANGPGYKTPTVNGRRYDISDDDLTDIYYEYPATFPLSSETHGGDDVAIFASGPWSHLFSSTLEQHAIPHLMAYASCIGNGLTACVEQADKPSPLRISSDPYPGRL